MRAILDIITDMIENEGNSLGLAGEANSAERQTGHPQGFEHEQSKVSSTDAIVQRIKNWSLQTRDLSGLTAEELSRLVAEAKEIDDTFDDLIFESIGDSDRSQVLISHKNTWAYSQRRREQVVSEQNKKREVEQLQRITSIVSLLEEMVHDTTFRASDGLDEYGGKSALEVVVELRATLGRLTEYASYHEREEIDGRLASLERAIENLAFEEWKLTLESTFVSIKDLRTYVERTQAEISAGVLNVSSIPHLEYLLQTAQNDLGDPSDDERRRAYLKTNYWEKAEAALDALNKQKELDDARAANAEELRREKEERLRNARTILATVREELENLKKQSITITKDTQEATKKAFGSLFEKLRTIETSLRRGELKEDVDQLQRDILIHRFQVNVTNYDSLLDFVEDKDIIGAGNEYNAVEQTILKEMKSLSTQLEELYRPTWIGEYGGVGPEYYREVTEEMTAAFAARAALNFGWIKMSEHVISSDARSVPDNVSSKDHLVINGKHVDQLINHGDFEPSTTIEREVQNVVMGHIKVRRLARESDCITRGGKLEVAPGVNTETLVINGKKLTVVVEEQQLTAMGVCLRIYDAVYRGDLILENSEGDIGVGDIHSNLGVLISYAHRRVNEMLGVDTTVPDWEKNERVPKTIADRALRLNSIVPMHQSGLSDIGTTGRSDQWYYLWRWHAYAFKYIKERKAKFSRLFTEFLVGSSAQNPLESVKEGFAESVKKVVDADKKRLDQKTIDRRIEEFGFSDFRFLANLPLFRISGESDPAVGYHDAVDEDGKPVKKRRVETRFFQPPLAVLTLGEKLVDLDSASPTLGRIATFDDYRAVGDYKAKQREYYSNVVVDEGEFVDSSGNAVTALGDEYIYEAMPWDQIQSKFMYEYVSELRSGPLPFWKEILYSDLKDAVSKMNSPTYVADLRKTVGYAVPFTKVATKVRRKIGGKDGGKSDVRVDRAVQNQMVDVLIFAFCLTKTSNQTPEKERWGTDELYEYLKLLYDNQAIAFDEMLMLYATVVKGRRMTLFASGLSREFKKQVGDFFKFSA